MSFVPALTRSAIVKAGLGLAVVATVGAAIVVVAEGQGDAPSRARAWVDSPLDGSELPLATVRVVVHGTAPSGVGQLELTVGGAPVVTKTMPEPLVTLARADFSWMPPGPGVYILAVRSRGGPAAAWSDPAVSTIYVGIAAAAHPPGDPTVAAVGPTSTPIATAAGQPTAPPSSAPATTPGPTTATTPRPTANPTPRPTAKPTPRPTAKPTPRPTPKPCTPAAPELLLPVGGTTVTTDRPTFRWAYRDAPSCKPSGFRIQVATDLQLDDVVLQANLGPNVTTWAAPRSLPSNCTWYYWRLNPKRSDGTLGPVSPVKRFFLQTTRTCP